MLLYSGMITSVSSPKVANISIYPNPTNDIIRVKKESGQKIEKIELYGMNGQLLRSTTNEFIKVSDVTSGTYILKVSLNEGIVTKPVIITH